MSVPVALLLFAGGLALVLVFSEQLVESVVGTAANVGLSAFLISVLFVGFDPENLFIGGTGTWERAPGIALGTVVGSAMVAIALALGITALAVPLRFERAPRSIVVLLPLPVGLLGALAADGLLSRVDGGLLLGAYALALAWLYVLGRRGIHIEPSGEVAEALHEDDAEETLWQAAGMLAVSLAAIAGGSKLVVEAGTVLTARIGLTDTAFGMTLLALLVSIEELARELPAALKGRPEIALGNVVGSVLAFFLFNAGVIALVRPVPVGADTRFFYVPVALLAVGFTAAVLLRRTVPRWAGGVLVALYAAFVVGGFLM
jgi:cation:H+ antiporter